MNKQLYIHLVSDSTGETVNSLARAAIAQFDNINAIERNWSLIRTQKQMEKVITTLDNEPGIVLYTVMDKQLATYLRAECQKRSMPCIAILSRVVTEISNYLGVESSEKVGRQYHLDDEYFSRVEAINFALAHDDGQAHWELDEADIVLVGASRTSKSPTCVYLAYRGFKAANVPFVYGCELPETIMNITSPLVVGLTISTERLVEIRRNRLKSLGQNLSGEYVDYDEVNEEVKAARKLFIQKRWPIIDVTRRSVEESAAEIMQYHQRHMAKKG